MNIFSGCAETPAESGSTTASSCIAVGGTCYDIESGATNACCSGSVCTPSSPSFTCQ